MEEGVKRGNNIINEMHLIMVADFGVLRYRSGSLHNANSLVIISERNTVRNAPKVAPKNTHSLQISISAHSHHTSTNSSVILNGIFIPHSKAHQALSRLGVTMLMTPRCS